MQAFFGGSGHGSRVLFALLCLLYSEILAKTTELLQRDEPRANTLEQLIRETEIDHNNTNDKFFWKPSNESVAFWLYTRARPNVRQHLSPDDTRTLKSSDFDGNLPTKIIVHGWLGNAEEMQSACTVLRSEYFKMSKYNVICVDWSSLALDLPYFTACKRCKQIGVRVAKLISMLINHTIQKIHDIHIIGFSMGAHIAGYAGKIHKGKIERITGLDPAKPLFSDKKPKERLDKKDAKFVDIVHTTNFILGQHQPIGKIDFYPNGGITQQPGCGFEYIYGEVCSHLKAITFFAMSIRSKEKLKAIKCESWKDYQKTKCKSNKFTYMGEYANPKLFGKYYLSVL